jgi:hypothetical protein
MMAMEKLTVLLTVVMMRATSLAAAAALLLLLMALLLQPCKQSSACKANVCILSHLFPWHLSFQQQAVL